MPRIAEGRDPAMPTSPEQKDRYRRILRAAAEHGAERGLERMQMHDVAKDAGVAIATLYRYFPSKTHLFTAILADQVRHLDKATPEPPPGTDPVAAISDLLADATGALLARPLLAHALLHSNNASVAEKSPQAQTVTFTSLMLRAGGIPDASGYALRLVNLVEQTWYGIMISALNQHLTVAEAVADTRLACRLLLREIAPA